MIRWKGFLVAGGAMTFAVGLAMAQSKSETPSDSTYQRLRQATLNGQNVPAPERTFHPLTQSLTDKPAADDLALPAAAVEASPAPTTTALPRAIIQEPIVMPKTVAAPAAPADAAPADAAAPASTDEPFAPLTEKYSRPRYTEVGTNAPIQRTGHVIEAHPAVHEVLKPNAKSADATDVIHAEYRPIANERNPIVQVKEAGPSPGTHITLVESKGDAGARTKAAHPHVGVQWKPAGEIVVGTECEFALTVKNHGDVAAEDLEVDAFFPESIRLTAARPQPSVAEEHLTWKISKLAPGEEQVLAVKLIPSLRGDLALGAKVRFTGQVKDSFTVAEPVLKIEITGPAEVMLGEPASHTVKISNPGTGTARDVALEALIPAGLKHPRGERLRLEVGTLEPGAEQEIHLALAAVEGGKHTLQIAATSVNSLRQVSDAQIAVAAPSLAVKVEGPGLRYKGRKGSYAIEVHNDGTAVSNNVRVRYRVPAGFDFVSTEEGGRFDERNRVIDWFVGKLDPEAKKSLTVELLAKDFGKFTHEVSAISEHGSQATAQIDTRVEGTAALSLEIVDFDDPVEVGAGNSYEIRIKNEGSLAANNVGIAFEMPAGVEFVSATGPTAHDVEKNAIFFHALPKVEAGASASFKIQVKGTKAGSHRFRARLASDSIQEPLIFEELTKYYGE